MKRMLVLIDGLNLFHSLQSQSPEQTNLDLSTLCQAFASNHGCDTFEILYFTALVEHLDKKSRSRQFQYLTKLEDTGIRVFKTEFRSQLEECSACGTMTRRYVEKQTDVSIAAHLISNVFANSVDEVLLFSADTDFLAALTLIREKKPHINLKVVSTPVYLRPIYGLLHKNGIGTIRLSPELVSRFQF
ncbi:MAG: hypothetical protein RLY34_39 [Actinomycetota bacterium]|jgi:uncharacterized LabA/DUF88 family protein